MSTPPDTPSEKDQFENANACHICQSGFGLFNRKHHCRQCFRTVCGSCSPSRLVLAQETQEKKQEKKRVCNGCVRKRNTKDESVSRKKKAESPSPQKEVAPARARREKQAPAPKATKKVAVCKCHMPLCICEPDPEPKAEPSQVQASQDVKRDQGVQQQERKKRPKRAFQGFGRKKKAQVSLEGDLNESCRDACKSKDVAGMKTLLDAKANPLYVDKTGNTLVHVAALFDCHDGVQLLIERRANVWFKNPANETAVDVAPISLAAKMRVMQPPPAYRSK
jgi:ribosomal protein S14